MEKFTIITQKQNPAFNRKEVEVNVETNTTPKISEAAEFIAKEFSSNAENVKIKKIKGRFGSNVFVITANIYAVQEDKDKIETRTKKVKKEAKK